MRADKNFFTFSPDMLCISSFDGSFRDVNPAWARVLGWHSQDLSGRQIQKLVHPEDQEAFRLELKKLSQGNTAENLVNRLQTKSGEWKWVSWNLSVSLSEQILYAVVRDITDFKQEVIKLEKEKLKTVLLLQNLPQNILEVNEKAEILYINHKIDENYNLSEILGSSAYKYIPPHEQDIFKDHLSSVFATAKPTEFEIKTLPGENGGFFKIDIVPLPSEHQVERAILIATDLTKDSLFSKELLESYDEAKWHKQAIVESGIVDVANKNGFIIYVNDNFEKLSGYSREELLGKKHRIFNSKVHTKEFYTELWDTIKNGKTWKGEICNKKKSGELCWLDTTIVPYIGPNGQVERFVSLRIDITSRKKIEADLRSSEQRLKTITEQLHDPIWLLSAKDGKLKYANELPSVEVFGYSQENFFKDPLFFRKIIHPDDLYLIDAAERELRTKSEAKVQYRVFHKSGQIKFVDVRMKILFSSNNEPLEILGITRDITEQQEQNRRIDEQKKSLVAKAKMSALGEMAGGIGHEINNPISIIHARSRHILDSLDSPHPDLEKIKKYADNIQTTSVRVIKIVQGLKNIARESKNDPHKTLRCGDLVDEVLLLCGEKFRVSGVNLSVVGSKDIQVECQPVQIEEVLLNLLSNAFDAIELIEDDSRWVRIELSENEKNIEIAVVDCGKGIPVEVKSKIMHPFYTTKASGKGSGLGLSISHDILERHGGKLYYDDESMNTRFVMVLPQKIHKEFYNESA